MIIRDKLLIKISACNEKQFEIVKKGIEEMHLDNRALDKKDFFIGLIENDVIAGFGRIRHYPNSAELCSLGVFEKFRNKGVGKTICKALINQFIENYPSNLYVVTIIPSYFEKLGFKVCQNTNHLPSEIIDKLNYCKTQLYVPEEYVVLSFNQKQPNLR
jgi:amino-acid N-acetyltransferase